MRSTSHTCVPFKISIPLDPLDDKHTRVPNIVENIYMLYIYVEFAMCFAHRHTLKLKWRWDDYYYYWHYYWTYGIMTESLLHLVTPKWHHIHHYQFVNRHLVQLWISWISMGGKKINKITIAKPFRYASTSIFGWSCDEITAFENSSLVFQINGMWHFVDTSRHSSSARIVTMHEKKPMAIWLASSYANRTD